MEDRDRSTGTDLDDWFAEPAPSSEGHGWPEPTRGGESPTLGRARPEAADDWLEAGEPTAGRRVRLGGGGTRPSARLALLGALFVVLLLVILATAGVFSGGGGEPQVTGTTTVARTQPTTTTTPQQPRTTSVPAPTTTLKPGDQGAQVKVLQRALVSLGYSLGKVDGIYGPGTQDAVKRFQQASGLTADGIAGAKTLSALKSALAGP